MRCTKFFGILRFKRFLAKRPDLVIINEKKKRTCRTLPSWQTICKNCKKTKKKKKDIYLDLARELKKLLSMKVTFIPIVIGPLGTVTKGLVQELEDSQIRGWIETVQTTALLKSARILKRTQETWGDLLSLNLYLKLVWETLNEWSNNNHHHHVVLLARISLTLSRYPSIATDRSFRLHPVLALSCCR